MNSNVLKFDSFLYIKIYSKLTFLESVVKKG